MSALHHFHRQLPDRIKESMIIDEAEARAPKPKRERWGFWAHGDDPGSTWIDGLCWGLFIGPLIMGLINGFIYRFTSKIHF